MFSTKNIGILTPEAKAKLLISKTIQKVSFAVFLLFISMGIFATFDPLLALMARFYQLFSMISFGLGIAIFIAHMNIYFKLRRRDVSRKLLRTSWMVICGLLIAEASVITGLLKVGGIIDYEFGKIAFIFAIPSVIFGICGLLVKYSNFDFTRLWSAIVILIVVLLVVRLTMFFTVNSTQTLKNVSAFAIVVHTGILLYHMGMMKKHYQFIKAMNTESANLFGEESMKFVYLYSIHLFNIFVDMVINLLIIMSRR